MRLESSMDRHEWRTRRRFRDRNLNRQNAPVGRLVIGLLIAIWGLGMLFTNLGLGDVREYLYRAFPAVLVIMGITLLIHRDPSRNDYTFWGTVWLLAGAVNYAAQQDWIRFTIGKLFVPVIIIVVGASFLYRGIKRSRAE